MPFLWDRSALPGGCGVHYARAMRFLVLGPLEVEADDGPVVLGGQKERLLLAQLLTRPNQVVPVEALVGGLWGEHPPSTAAKTLQSHVVRLRRALEPGRARGAAGEVLVTREPGYLLRVAPGALDAARFEELTAAGRRALADDSVELAGSLLRDALGLWRGRAFEEFLDADFGAAESNRLAELRLVALEDRLEADLRLGRHRELVAELEGLVREQPLRERLWAQLMLALYRSGRQADALLAYQRARSVLVEELGIDPGADLRRLQAAILAQDPGLDLPASAETDPGPEEAFGQEEAAQVLSLHETAQASRAGAGSEEQTPGQTVGSRSHLRLVRTQVADDRVDLRESGGERRVVPAGPRRSRWRLAAAGLLVAMLIASALVANRIGNRGSDVAAIAANSLGLIQGKSNALVGQVPLEVRSGQLAVDEGAVWVASEDGTVSRVDAATRRVVQRIAVGRDPAGVAAGDGAVWVANSGDRSVSWINPSTNTEVKRVPVGNGPTGIALWDGAVWVANSLDNSVSRIDADTGKVVATIGVGGTPSGVAAGLGAVWVSNATDGTVSRISPATGTVVRPIPVGNGPRAIAVGADAVWVANGVDGTVSRIDPASDTVVATVGVGDGPSAVAVSPAAVWAASELRGTVTRLDPETNTVARRIDVRSAPAGAAVAGDSLWVTTQGAPSSHRGGTVKVTTAGTFGIASLDPAMWNQGENNLVQGQFLTMTNDGLVGYKRVGGVDGSTVVADLATALPRPTDGGTTYTFRLRPGIRYSTGQGVTPEDVRWSIERGFRLRSTMHRESFRGVVGANACTSSPATCRLSKGIVIDPSANTVTFHLARPDPDFLLNLAQPTAFVVPAGTPTKDVGTSPVPATGPTRSRSSSRTGSSRWCATLASASGPAPPNPTAIPTRSTGACRAEAPAPAWTRRSTPSSAGGPTSTTTSHPTTGWTSSPPGTPARHTCGPMRPPSRCTSTPACHPLTILESVGRSATRSTGARSRAVSGASRDRLPTAAAELPRLPALLPLHAGPQPGRGLDGPRSHDRRTPDQGIGNQRDERHHLVLPGLRRSQPLLRPAPRLPRLPHSGQDPRRHLPGRLQQVLLLSRRLPAQSTDGRVLRTMVPVACQCHLRPPM